jgi:hypothetical protein
VAQIKQACGKNSGVSICIYLRDPWLKKALWMIAEAS